MPRGQRVTLVKKAKRQDIPQSQIDADRRQMEEWLAKNEAKKLPTSYAYGYAADAGDMMSHASNGEKEIKELRGKGGRS